MHRIRASSVSLIGIIVQTLGASSSGSNAGSRILLDESL